MKKLAPLLVFVLAACSQPTGGGPVGVPAGALAPASQVSGALPSVTEAANATLGFINVIVGSEHHFADPYIALEVQADGAFTVALPTSIGSNRALDGTKLCTSDLSEHTMVANILTHEGPTQPSINSADIIGFHGHATGWHGDRTIALWWYSPTDMTLACTEADGFFGDVDTFDLRLTEGWSAVNVYFVGGDAHWRTGAPVGTWRLVD